MTKKEKITTMRNGDAAQNSASNNPEERSL